MLTGTRALRRCVATGTSKNNGSRTGRRVLVMAAAGSAVMMARLADAASGTWAATSAGNWNTPATNWASSVVPGATATITGTNANPDTATFNTATAGNVTIDSASENVKSITFDTNLINGFTLGSTAGNALYLSSTGTLQIASTFAAVNFTENVNAPLVIEGLNGTYTIQNNKGGQTGLSLVLGGNLSGDGGGNTVVTFGGNGTPTMNYENGIVANGNASTLGITQTAANWTYAGLNTYTGPTLVTGGSAYFTGASTSTSAITVGRFDPARGKVRIMMLPRHLILRRTSASPPREKCSMRSRWTGRSMATGSSKASSQANPICCRVRSNRWSCWGANSRSVGNRPGKGWL